MAEINVTMETRMLKGFSKALDFRPIPFSKPPPPLHSCDLCGVVSPNPVFAGCRHSFCNTCCQLVSREKQRRCPRDQMTLHYTGGFTTENAAAQSAIVRGYGMRCPNFPHGCKYVLKNDKNITALEDHYSACKYHVVSCQACGTSVVRDKIVDHLMDSCKTAKPKKMVLADVD